jgi:hypothetical protein
MQSLIDDLQIDLADSAASVWSESELLQFLSDAIRYYSLVFPRLRSTTITAVADDRKYDLPTDHIRILSVEYPTGEDPPEHLIRSSRLDRVFWQKDSVYDVVRYGDQDVDDEIWIGDKPNGGETLTIQYLAYHPHTLAASGFCTVPIEHHHILKSCATWLASRNLQMAQEGTPTSNSSILMGQLALNTERLRDAYYELVQELKEARV